MYDHETYLSPLTWRYGSEEMRHLWSEAHKRRLWRRIWVALAEAQTNLGWSHPSRPPTCAPMPTKWTSTVPV